MRSYRSDVLVLGSGGAGVRAAIAASAGGSVTLVSKGPLGRSGATILSGADVMADGESLHRLGLGGDPADTPVRWAKDIVVEGFHLNDENLVRVYVENAGDRLAELVRWGLTIREAGRRAVITTGTSISAALRRGLASTRGVTAVPGVMAFDLLVNRGQAVGALGVDCETGEIVLFQAKAVVLATGGWHQAYSFNAGATELTGDGQAMAFRAGAELVDMEMVTFCPNILLSPPKYRGSLILYLIPGVLLNSHGDAFLGWEPPKIAKLAATSEWNKLLFSKASMQEVLAGRGSPHGGVYFSLKHLPENLFDRLQEIVPNWHFQGDDFTELFSQLRAGFAAEVGPAAEYFEGGVYIDERCATTLPGLFAAGECSGGLFGANRVAAATTEMLVLGEVAGREAAAFATQTDSCKPDPYQVEALTETALSPLTRKDGSPVAELWTQVRELAYREVGVIRTGSRLRAAVGKLEELECEWARISLASNRRRRNLEWLRALELRNLIQCVKISAQAAVLREESRGVHIRSDRPFVDNDRWRVHLRTWAEGDGTRIGKYPVVSETKIPPNKVPYEEAILEAAETLLGREEAA